jgi:hypothetical protein
MKLVVKRRELTDPGQLQALVTDHVEAIEPGLAVLDSRLLLGQATIDVVGLDADGALVLIAVGPVADEEMLLKAVEAYSWCLEYPEAIRRLYPSAHFSSAQPLRLIFVVERMPDSFHRKIKQLGFPQVDCVEFRYLDVDGTPAVSFENLARLRRGPVAAAPVPSPERVVPPSAPVSSGRPTSMKLQKMLGADRPVREPAQIVSLVHRTVPRAEKAVLTRTFDEPTMAVAVSEHETSVGQASALLQSIGAPIVVAPVPTVEPVATLELVSSPIATVDHVAAALAMPDPIVAAPPAKAVTTPAEPIIPMAAPAPTMVAAPKVTLETIATPEPPSAAPAAELPTLMLETASDAAPIAAGPIEPLALEIAEPAAPEPIEPLVLEIVTPVVDAFDPLVLDIAEPVVAEPIEPLVLEIATPVVAEPIEPLVLEIATPVVAEPIEPLVLEIATPVVAEPIEPLVLEIATPVVAEVVPAPIQTAEPAATPSVFARRATEAAAPAAERKVSFADAAKELLAVTTPAPRSEPAVAVHRPSVEEMTRATLDDLVGATAKPAAPEERVTAFAKTGGAFAKPAAPKALRTIAPGVADPPPIAAAPKLGAAPKRMATPTPAPQAPAAPPPQPPAAQQAPPQGFEGLQFPNDGVLTRQWMEFLNQMAAGK